MKKCPYCYEDIQDVANICKHCGRDQATGKAVDWLIPEAQSPAALDTFEKFMVSYGRGWVLINKSNSLLSYQKVIPAQKGSCLVAFFLLWLAIIPGILYMIYGNRQGKTYQLSVSLDGSGSLVPSGDSEGMRVYGQFLNSIRNQ